LKVGRPDSNIQLRKCVRPVGGETSRARWCSARRDGPVCVWMHLVQRMQLRVVSSSQTEWPLSLAVSQRESGAREGKKNRTSFRRVVNFFNCISRSKCFSSKNSSEIDGRFRTYRRCENNKFMWVVNAACQDKYTYIKIDNRYDIGEILT